MILKAADFARKAHAGQTRKWTGTPYIYHPMRVAGRAMLIPVVPEYVVAAAWLHDVVEDCDVTKDDLVREFGSPVTAMVVELTNPSKKYPHRRRADRKQMDREHLCGVSYWSKVLKALDRIDNLGELDSGPADFQRLYREESQLLSHSLIIGWPGNPLLEELTSQLRDAA